jgi:ribosomal-protein-alanine N-acetyltransferase
MGEFDVDHKAGGQWSIEPANWRDLNQLHQLERSCFTKQDIWPFWDLIGILTLPGYVRLKAVADELMIGFIGGEKDSTRRVGWITTIATLPEYRRRGIAFALLEACEIALGMPTIRLSVRVSNDAAIRLYERADYYPVKRWKKYYTGGEDALVFEKSR